jgi:hypothetical protein
MEPKYLSQRSQERAVKTYLESVERSPELQILFVICSNINFPYTYMFRKYNFTYGCPIKILYACLISVVLPTA